MVLYFDEEKDLGPRELTKQSVFECYKFAVSASIRTSFSAERVILYEKGTHLNTVIVRILDF